MKKSLLLTLFGIAIAMSSPWSFSRAQKVLSLDPKATTETSILVRKQEVERFQKIMHYAIASNLATAPMSEILQAIAEQFLGTPYRAGLLDSGSSENLIISLDKFDCVIFVETVLAIARNVALKSDRYQTFTDHIVDQRYRNGQMNGYCTRLHYFSEWIGDNQRRGNVENITLNLGGVSLNKRLNFISTHRNYYPQLVKNNNYQCIVEMEANLARWAIDYLPTNKIVAASDRLRPGDIIAITTDIAGLDVTHTGLVYRTPQGKTGLIHASLKGRVIISPNLPEYVASIEHSTGIIVARPNDPRKRG